ncbi:hypothetical protein [Enterococcus faecium]|uniref:hypothetical protein n=1 Tax=Enterococcus faecium TaxID=1352 RepID=UPI0015E48DF6|nr:hypothetical protein [Enterococcus faecium]
MFKPLIDSYSAVLKKFKGKDIGATINEEVNIDRLKTIDVKNRMGNTVIRSFIKDSLL